MMKQKLVGYAAVFLFLASPLAAEGAPSASESEKARSGDAALQYDLAVHYLFDKQLDENNVEQAPDYAEAFKWLKQSAEGGNKEACTLLGLMYERGRGTPLDSEKAKYWFKKAREK